MKEDVVTIVGLEREGLGEEVAREVWVEWLSGEKGMIEARGGKRGRKGVELDEIQTCNEKKLAVGGKRPAFFVVTHLKKVLKEYGEARKHCSFPTRRSQPLHESRTFLGLLLGVSTQTSSLRNAFQGSLPFFSTRRVDFPFSQLGFSTDSLISRVSKSFHYLHRLYWVDYKGQVFILWLF
jgi:hypothetical protein